MSETRNVQFELRSEQQILDSAFQNIAHRGALVVFSQLRDEAVSDAKKFQNVAENYLAENEANAAERAEIMRIANVTRNKVIRLQYAVDAAYKFSCIESTPDGCRVN